MEKIIRIRWEGSFKYYLFSILVAILNFAQQIQSTGNSRSWLPRYQKRTIMTCRRACNSCGLRKLKFDEESNTCLECQLFAEPSDDIRMPSSYEKLETITQYFHNRLRIASLNCRSLKPKFDEIRRLLLGPANIDVLLLQETWLKSDDDLISLQVPGYQFFSNCRLCIGGGGTAAYAKTLLKPKIVEHLVIPASSSNLEVQTLKIHPSNTITFVIANVYRPPNSDLLQQNLHALSDFFNDLYSCGTNFAIFGDFNINFAKPGNAYDSIATILEQNSLVQNIHQYSRLVYDNNSVRQKSLIDLMITNESKLPLYVDSIELSVPSIDHCLICAVLDTRRSKVKTREKIVRSYSRINTAEFQRDLELVDWSAVSQLLQTNSSAAVEEGAKVLRRKISKSARQTCTRKSCPVQGQTAMDHYDNY